MPNICEQSSLSENLQPEKNVTSLSYDDLVIFDFKNILCLLGNNQIMLTEVLHEFKNSMQSFLTDLNELLLAEDRLAAMALVHDLKGTAGNMGAVRLHAAVTDLNAELKVSLPNQASVQCFSLAFVATMVSLDNILKPPE
jgi:HPt (histidine-containing phosphotransfer) domain-containing protein